MVFQDVAFFSRRTGMFPYFNNITFLVSVNNFPDCPVDSSRIIYIPAGKPVALNVVV